MKKANRPQPDLVKAHAALSQDQRIEDVEPLKQGPNGSWVFRLKARVVQPNDEELPDQVILRIQVPQTYPYVPVEVFSDSPEVRGFNHQDAETHKLCLREESRAPCDHERLSVYIDWALDWLNDAALRKLLPPGDPYELPDFSRKLLKDKLPIQKKVWFCESSKSYPSWRDRVGQTGKVTLFELENPRVVLATSFSCKGDVVWEFPLTSTFESGGIKIDGCWALLPSLAFVRNKPPQRFGELHQMFASSGIDLDALLKELWFSNSGKHNYSILMVGALIPRISGEPPSEVHWQPLGIRNIYDETGIKPHKMKLEKRLRSWRSLGVSTRYIDAVDLPWLSCENVAPERLYSRGMLNSSLQQRDIVLVGCGAIGSCLADQLVRAGAAKLTLIDKEEFEPGNHARHVIPGQYQYVSKATALKIHLQRGSPYTHLQAFVTNIPDFNSTNGPIALASINECDVIVDCSAHESAFQWLSKHGALQGKEVIHMFISFDSRFLNLVFS